MKQEPLVEIVDHAEKVDPRPNSSTPCEREISEISEISPPSPMAPEAFHGILGTIVRAIEPETEASPEVLLVTLLAAVGNSIGRGPYFRVEDDQHGTNLFIAIVGKTSKGRKGVSWGRVKRIMGVADPLWARDRVAGGVKSGEVLIYAVRDQRVKQKADGSEEIIDEGVIDKRLFVLEEELAAILGTMQREGSTISSTCRQAWDRGDIGNLSKTSPDRATGSCISMVGHITKAELVRTLDRTSIANGFGNRFLFVSAYRSKLLPDGGKPVDAARWGDELRTHILHAKAIREVGRTSAARDLWHVVYPQLSADRPGLWGEITSRGEAQVVRLALLFALLDGKSVVDLVHLRAALAVWEYCSATAAWIFGLATGDPVADAIMQELQRAPDGMSRTDISAALGRHQPAARIDKALALLREAGLAVSTTVPTPGRPVEWWTLFRLFRNGHQKLSQEQQLISLNSLVSHPKEHA